MTAAPATADGRSPAATPTRARWITRVRAPVRGVHGTPSRALGTLPGRGQEGWLPRSGRTS